MQLHMISDDEIPGGKRFSFWSRKAKEYTYLYGNGFEDPNSALTRHLKEAFDEGVENIVLDGEMITWDPEQDAMVPFGYVQFGAILCYSVPRFESQSVFWEHKALSSPKAPSCKEQSLLQIIYRTLKTAALAQQRNEFATKSIRPLYKVFDILYLNSQEVTNYTLRDRRRALEGAVKGVARRIEIHTYEEARDASAIDPLLRKVVAEASEGLVLKNPRSSYRLNQRNDDWMKVKPEYMTEFGENLDCLIIGGYYGSGHRGGRLSSFMCGLRVDQNQISQGANPMKFYSFFKVGGGFTAADYAELRHRTDGKWRKWDSRHPPTEYIALGGDQLQAERPDEWILPSDSVVVEVKAASVAVTDQFKMGLTLRFPRFKKLRTDRTWETSLSISEFITLKGNAEKEGKEKQFKIDDGRRKRQRVPRKKPLTVAGAESLLNVPFGRKATNVLEGLNFCTFWESH